MANVVVITGGGSGMGLEAAKCMPKEKIIVLSGRTVAKLENAVNALTELGFTAYAHACDTSDRESVRKLAQYAKSLGTVRNVIDFGAFVDIGVHQDGLVHISRMSKKKFVKHPLDVVSVGDVVDVKVVEVDLKKKRIGLSMVL